MSDCAPRSKPWTPAQRVAIEHRGGHLAVSASAGSGKTAVLTERVMRWLLGGGSPEAPVEPVRLERMLIITFTEKAAREMRERIERELRERLDLDADNILLRQALDALPSAWVMTIDAFCRRLVVEHFHRAGVSPDPRIPEATELDRLERQTLQRLLEEHSADPERREELAWLVRGGSPGGDGVLGEVRQVMRFLESLDDPERWLRETRGKISTTLTARFYGELPEASAAGEGFRRSLLEYVEALREGIRAAGARPHDPACLEHWEALAGELVALASPKGAFYPGALASVLHERFEPTLAKLMNKGVCGGSIYEDKSFIAQILKPLAKHFERLMKHWFPLDEQGLLRGARLAARQGEALLALAEDAGSRMAEQKRRRGLVTFNDFERLALKVLSDPSEPAAPSDIADGLRRQFEAVMVDEYQDTSPLQDAIIRRVARWDDPGAEGNLFLVGDYKQSIYRFRFAEPDLFRSLIDTEHPDHPVLGGSITPVRLGANFRSRPGVLAFVNSVFDRLMDPAVGDIDYRLNERLAPHREAAGEPNVEAYWLTPSGGQTERPGNEEEGESGESGEAGDQDDAVGLEGVEAQAAFVARRIRALTRGGDSAPFKAGECAILLRSLRFELDVWARALEREGLKVRAQGIDPLFTAPELLDLVAALRIADNPFQDIPLAGVMRSPLGGFSDDDLLRIRLARREGEFYQAVWSMGGREVEGERGERERRGEEEREKRGNDSDSDSDSDRDRDNNGDFESDKDKEKDKDNDFLGGKVERFLAMLDGWRGGARLRPAAEVLDLILSDTHHEAWLAGHPGAEARLEHVDFLRGLLRKLGGTAEGENSLGAFLETVDRALESADRVGELPETVARADDAVHLLTMHGAKGLEFPVIFLPRLERRFRVSKISDMLLDRTGGLALRGVDPERRRQYPTLLHRSLSDGLRRKDRSEELRLLYVAMTRARERLVLIGEVRDREALTARARRLAELGDRPLPAIDRLHAAAPIDLLGPLTEALAMEQAPAWLRVEEIGGIAEARRLEERPLLGKALARPGGDPAAEWELAIDDLRNESDEDVLETARIRLLPGEDPARRLTVLPMKTTVTALRRMAAEEAAQAEELREEEAFFEAEMVPVFYRREGKLAETRPAWTEEPQAMRGRLDGAARGTILHSILARVPLDAPPTAEVLRRAALDALARSGKIAVAEGGEEKVDGLLESLDLGALEWFFQSEIGQAMLARPRSVSRELAFTAAKSVADFDAEAGRSFPQEKILLHGIIDAIIDEGAGATLVDYKTDKIFGGRTVEALAESYRLQLSLYARSLRAIWGIRSLRAALVFLDARRIVWLEEAE